MSIFRTQHKGLNATILFLSGNRAINTLHPQNSTNRPSSSRHIPVIKKKQKKREQNQSEKKKQKPGENGLGMAMSSLFLGLVFMQSGSLIVLGGALLAYIAGLVISIRGIKKRRKGAKLSLFILLLIGFAALIVIYEIMTMPGLGADPFSGII